MSPPDEGALRTALTQLAPRAVLPDLRQGGTVRRLAIVLGCVVVWATAVLLLAAGFVPELDGDEGELSVRVTFLVLGVAVALLPVVLLWLPQRRLALQWVAALPAAAVPRVPAVADWVSPARMFQRLRWTSYTVLLIPLLSLLTAAAAYGMYLDEDAAAAVSLVFCIVPLVFLVVTATTTQRIRSGVQAGLDAGQAFPVRVTQRLDRTFSASVQSWFETQLPDGQRCFLRTPVRFAWAADARGVIDSPDLVLVVGRGGHQGALVVPSRPQDAVWLLGPVPAVRVPRGVLRAFAQAQESG
jgi:hypothetical protein